MLRRTMGVMGLLAFAITVLGGLSGGNTVEFILPRALWAMAIFCLLGLIVGWAAEMIVQEHQAKQYAEVFGPKEGDTDEPELLAAQKNNSTADSSTPIQN